MRCRDCGWEGPETELLEEWLDVGDYAAYARLFTGCNAPDNLGSIGEIPEEE